MLSVLSQRAIKINPPLVVRVYKATVNVQGESTTVKERKVYLDHQRARFSCKPWPGAYVTSSLRPAHPHSVSVSACLSLSSGFSLVLAKFIESNCSDLQLLWPFYFLSLPLQVWVLSKFSQKPEKWKNHSFYPFPTVFWTYMRGSPFTELDLVNILDGATEMTQKTRPTRITAPTWWQVIVRHRWGKKKPRTAGVTPLFLATLKSALTEREVLWAKYCVIIYTTGGYIRHETTLV